MTRTEAEHKAREHATQAIRDTTAALALHRMSRARIEKARDHLNQVLDLLDQTPQP